MTNQTKPTKLIVGALLFGIVGFLLIWRNAVVVVAQATDRVAVSEASDKNPSIRLGSSAALSGTIEAQHKIYLPLIVKSDLVPVGESPTGDWSMAGANPQRTSWVPEQVPSADYLASHRNTWGNGLLYPQWYMPFEPFINGKIQVITANGLLYISTSRGLYALRADNGNIVWTYPTELPLGNSPTVIGNILYVGGYDHKIHALNALTGQAWPGWTSYEAGAGFDTNPLVVDGTVYAGNRDGNFYAFDAMTGALKWTFTTGGPILYSAAYQDGIVYFASDDSYAYAVNTAGQQVWKSAKLPGAGFHSYWPVIYQNYVIFTGSHNYLFDQQLNFGSVIEINQQELHDAFPNYATDPAGTLIGSLGKEPGSWVSNTVTLNDSQAVSYFASKPTRRTYFVLDRLTGQESPNAPILWNGTQSGNRYPPVIGQDGTPYQFNIYISGPYIAQGQVSGWKLGTPFISLPTSRVGPSDEPHCASSGGNIIYWAQWFGNSGGAFDISVPNTSYPNIDNTREWTYYDYDVSGVIPGFGSPSSPDAVYGYQTLNCPVPYQGKIYDIINNSIVAWGMTQTTPVKLPLAQIVAASPTTLTVTTDDLKQRLSSEISKIIQAGHLRPGYYSQGLGDLGSGVCCQYLVHYFSNPADTLYALSRALPYLPTDLQQQTKTYLQQEFAAYPPYTIAHIGWRDGAAREAFDLLPEVAAKLPSFAPLTAVWTDYWNFPQDSFYGMWKYAQVFGGAQQLFDNAKGKLATPPSDSYFSSGYTQVLNAYIAGYVGYLNLQQLAGYPPSATVQATLNHLLALAANNFAQDPPAGGWGSVKDYMSPLNVSRNFMYLVPELATYLHDHALAKVQQALTTYQTVVPYWFVSQYDATYGEGTLQQLFDYNALFQAKALILQEPQSELVKYLDVPAFARGDLFYIHNLVSAIEASP